jgi:hypothetical protein
MTKHNDFRMAKLCAAGVGFSAPAAIFLTSLSGYFNSSSVAYAAMGFSTMAACSFGYMAKSFFSGMAKNLGGADVMQGALAKPLKENLNKVMICTGLMEASLHAGMYFTAISFAQGMMAGMAGAVASFAGALWAARGAIGGARSVTEMFRQNDDQLTSKEGSKEYKRGRSFARLSGVCSVSAISMAVYAVHAGSVPLLMMSAIPSLIGATAVSQVAKNAASNARRYLKSRDTAAVDLQAPAKKAQISGGAAELSVHASMLFSGAAILSDNPVLWGGAVAALASCSWFASKTLESQADAVKKVATHNHAANSNVGVSVSPKVA